MYSRKSNITATMGHKLLLVVSLLVICATGLHAQSTLSQNQDGFHGAEMDGFLTTDPGKDSTVVEREVSQEYKQWIIDRNTGLTVDMPLDTVMHYFESEHLTEGHTGRYSYLGNMGSPRLSRVYFDRNEWSDFIFEQPYSYYVKDASEFRFTDTKTPHLNLSYFKGGNKTTGEERIKGYFAANFNKKVGIGLNMDYLLGRGRYDSQSTSMFDTRLYTYWRGNKYNAYITANSDEIKVAENGGIFDRRYITNPEAMAEGRKQYAPEDIPFRMYNNWNNIKRKQLMFSQSFKLNKTYEYEDSIVTPDTIFYTTRKEVKTISTIAHTMETGNLTRRYIYHTIPDNFYSKIYLNNDSLDSTREFYITNTLSISLNEGFSKWAIADISAYLRHDLRSYSMSDTLADRGISSEYQKKHIKNNLYLGGQIKRSANNNLSFGANAETIVLGEDAGDISLNGNMQYRFNLLKRDAILGATATMSNLTPSYYYGQYHSAYCWWDLNLKREFTTRITGNLNIESTSTNISAGVENKTNYTYLTNLGTSYDSGNRLLPTYNIKAKQHDGSIQVVWANLQQNFKLGPLHWDNDVTWQVSSNKEVLPLPQINIFTDLYLKFLYSKRLEIEAGANMTYFTRYQAPTYSPAAGLYHLQNGSDIQEIGGYPLINAYANLRIKGVRFYVMYYHANDGLLKNTDSFFVPGYPINPSMVKFGLNWTFFD